MITKKRYRFHAGNISTFFDRKSIFFIPFLSSLFFHIFHTKKKNHTQKSNLTTFPAPLTVGFSFAF